MNIVVTGASSGIGFQISARLAAIAGNTVVALSRNSEKLERLKSESLRQNPGSTLQVFTCDIADEQSVKTVISQIKSQLKQVDILVNNAGLLINKPFDELTSKDWSDVYSTNVFGAVNVIRNLLPLMKNGSHILNISSMGGVQGSVKFKGLSAYSSSKAALIGLTECLAEEFHEKNIAVNCLALGSVQTEMFAAAFPSSKASVSATEMSDFISRFAVEGQKLFNGKIIPVSNSTP
jgi:NAD(P)-dependent dehydrogenase (short-subunit alcohol dehydrogenase family)